MAQSMNNTHSRTTNRSYMWIIPLLLILAFAVYAMTRNNDETTTATGTTLNSTAPAAGTTTGTAGTMGSDTMRVAPAGSMDNTTSTSPTTTAPSGTTTTAE